MSTENGYYRHPTIHGPSVVFVCEDDLWSVSAEGGIARRLTANPGIASFPVFSPDGKSLAFTGRDEGPSEVYVVDAQGGPPRRLTWLGSMLTSTVGWKPDGKSILFASDWRQPFAKEVWLHSVPAQGGETRPLAFGPARTISFQSGGPGTVIGRNSGDPARWKRYRGGTAGTIWIDRTGSGAYAPLLKLPGNLAKPMWIGERIYFLSDHEGYGNLYSCTPTGRGLRRHTHHEDFYVRFPSTDGRRIVYHAGADIFVFDSALGSEQKVEIRILSPRSQRNRKFAPAGRYLESFSLHPAGHSLASAHRGGLFTYGLWEGAPLRWGTPSSVRYRLPQWLPDGRRVAAVSDEGGEESILIFQTGGPEQPGSGQAAPRGRARGRAARPAAADPAAEEVRRIRGEFGRPLGLTPSPAGDERLALTNQRQEVILVDLKSGKSKVIEHSPFGRIEGLAWSPDGRWLAYGYPGSSRTVCLHLYDTKTSQISEVTRPEFRDVHPAFDPEGRYLYFVSFRIFDPVYDGQYFDLGFPKGARPCLLTLKRDLPSPFMAATRTPRAPGASPAGNPAGEANTAGEGKPEEKKPVQVEIDLDGIADRVVPFPVAEGIYDRILGNKSRAFFTLLAPEGSLDANFMDTGEAPAKAVLQSYLFEDDKTETVSDRVTDFALSADGKTLALRSGNRIRVVPASVKTEGKPPKDEPGRESGWCDLDRLRLTVDPAEEWRQMFAEAWRLQRDQYFAPDMSGIDWQEVKKRYAPLVERVSSRAEFSDLLWELQGELGTSHCYELGGDYRPAPGYYQGFLGVDLAFDAKAGAWKVTRIPHGDSWDERRCSPLAAPGVLVREGDYILRVGGQPAGRGVSPFELLVHQAGREVQLTVRACGMPAPSRAKKDPGGPKPGEVRTVTVKTLGSENALRYRDWVEQNRAWVHRQSKGRVGYLHIPNMGPWGYSEFHRYFLTEVYHEGLIIDVRYNGGGHVSQLLLEKLLRRRIAYGPNRWGAPEPYPMDSPMGPMVALTNEHAGSDGDIFSHGFKLYGLGPLVGKRTWGGVVGIWPRHSLVDGTLTTQPEFAFWFTDVGFGVENYGTDPDIEVEIKPQDHAAGRDPQLERALFEVEKLIRKMKPAVPEFKNPPRLKPGKLPKAI